jgi:hypothetical protein
LPEAVADLWAAEMVPAGFPKLLGLRDGVRRKILARVNVKPGKRGTLDWWRGFFTVVREDPFLSGRLPAKPPYDKPFRASLSWLVETEDRLMGVLEKAAQREREEAEAAEPEFRVLEPGEIDPSTGLPVPPRGGREAA